MLTTTKSRGRPTVFNKETVHILEQAFANGCTVEEACSVSGVSRSAYYKRLEDDGQFMDRMERAKLFMIIQARHTICNAIRAGDIKTSMWFLERKCKDEFSLKSETTSAQYLEIDDYTNAELLRLVS